MMGAGDAVLPNGRRRRKHKTAKRVARKQHDWETYDDTDDDLATADILPKVNY